MGLFNLFQKKEKEMTYLEAQREIDRNHDIMMEEFAKRDRDHDQWRREVDQVAKESMNCFNIISVLSQKGYISSDIWADYIKQEEWTAYLPIEIGPILKKIWSSNDGVLIHQLYRSL